MDIVGVDLNTLRGDSKALCSTWVLLVSNGLEGSDRGTPGEKTAIINIVLSTVHTA